MRKYVGLARVSSREQEREGFSLDVQVEALERYGERNGGKIVKLYRIAETASKKDERQSFRELLAYVRQHAAELDGVLFYKVDRAARNLFDYVELERLEIERGVPVIYVAQPTENTPAGRMQRRILANMAAFYTEQQSLDVQEGMRRRVLDGLFVGHAPYGYRNVRVNGRSVVEVDAREAANVRRAFELYGYHEHTLDSLADALHDEGRAYVASRDRFPRSKLYAMLTDRSYVGAVRYRGEWHQGTHEPLVDLATFERVQERLGKRDHSSHESVYGAEAVRCGYCGHPLVCEVKAKLTRAGVREYRYYRCSRYNTPGHLRVRVREAELDAQVHAVFERLRVQDERVRAWIVRVLQARSRGVQQANRERFEDLRRQLEVVKAQADRLLNLRMCDEIGADTFGEKNAELQDRKRHLTALIEAGNGEEGAHSELAVKVFELSQALRQKWDAADIAAKRQILDILCLNWKLDGVSLVPEMRKPFDVIAKGLVVRCGRGAGIWTRDLQPPMLAL